MTRSKMALPRFLRVSSALIIFGLIAEIVSLVWFHPLAFVVFVFVATSLVATGMLVYLFSLVFIATRPENRRRSPE